MDPHRWETIQAAFDELVALDAAARVTRLTALGTTDPDVRAAVESLLAADAEADARLASVESLLSPALAGPQRPDPAGPPPDLFGLTGRTVSHFRVLEPLGAGGMGVVYRAEDTRLGRAVALKFLLPQYSLEASAKARFLREARSAAALDHANLCTIHEVGESEDGRLFLAMALYPGETLKARVAREGPLPVAAALEITIQIAQGLACAHAAGIVHRDLKPGNVMLLPYGTVKILDFGLAKVRDQSLSSSGARLGTASYMAPEQIRGEAVDGRADLWALGVVLYEMLTGRKPFGGEHEAAVAHAILHDEPVRPSTLRPDVPAVVEELVLKLLEKDPTSRYAAAEPVLADLAPAAHLAEPRVRSTSTRRFLSSRAVSGKRSRIVFGTAALVLGALGYAAIARLNGDAAGAAERTALAVLPFQNLSAEGPHAYFAGGLHDEILTQLSKVAALKVISRTSVMGYAGPNTPPLRQVAKELGVGSIVQGSVQVVGERLRVHVQLVDAATDAQLWAQHYDRTLDDAFAVESDIAQQIVAAVGLALSGSEQQGLAAAPTANAEAYRLYLQGGEYWTRPNSRRQDLEIAQQLYERALALDPDFALARAALSEVHGRIYWLGYDRSQARAALQRQAADAALRLAPDLPQAHHAMGLAHYWGRRDFRRALEEFAIALKGLPNDAELWFSIGAVQRRLGNWEQVLAAFEKATELNPRYAHLFEDLGGNTYVFLHRYADAVLAYDRALSLAPDFQVAAVHKGWVYVQWQGQFDTLRAVLNRLPTDPDLGPLGVRAAQDVRLLYWQRQADSLLQFLRAARVAVIEGNPTALYAAWAHELRGDRPAARSAFGSARVLLDSMIRERPDDPSVHVARGLALAGLGRHDAALREARWLSQSVVYREDAFSRPGLAECRASILAQAGEAGAALDEIERLLARPSWLSVHKLRLDPLWDPIRNEPRFQALLKKYRN